MPCCPLPTLNRSNSWASHLTPFSILLMALGGEIFIFSLASCLCPRPLLTTHPFGISLFQCLGSQGILALTQSRCVMGEGSGFTQAVPRGSTWIPCNLRATQSSDCTLRSPIGVSFRKQMEADTGRGCGSSSVSSYCVLWMGLCFSRYDSILSRLFAYLLPPIILCTPTLRTSFCSDVSVSST